MNNFITATEIGISTESYDSIAFKGDSAQHLARVIDEITQLSTRGALYPSSFATWRHPELKHSISLQPHYQNVGRITPAEAVAMKVVAEEGSAISQHLGHDPITKLIRMEVGDPNCWPQELVDGMASFGFVLGWTARIREKITGKVTTFAEETSEEVETAIKQDRLAIGKKTVEALIKYANDHIHEQIKAGGGYSDYSEKDIKEITKSRKKGIELGAKIYLQVLEIAIQRGMPATLEKSAMKK